MSLSSSSNSSSSANAPEALSVAALTGWTPAGVQRLADLRNRRRFVALACALTLAGLLIWLARILGHDGWSVIDIAIFVCFVIAAPWSVLGVVNAALGLWLLHGARDPMRQAAPWAALGDEATPLHTQTAVLMTVCNEPPARAFARLAVVRDSVERTGQGAHFAWFVLSDTTNPDVAREEERLFLQWRQEVAASDEAAAARLVYRRRDDNVGYKAGNLRDFCERWGEAYTFMLPLDADSLMTGEAILRLVRIAQALPQLGILQSLVVGAPTRSAFARLFQFGMRHGMRSYTMGAIWWSGDCGPYWGHNALVRIAPFRDHCHLPELPGAPPLGGRILSHDQVEAVMMRRAGFEVRVLPVEGGSYEDNPPTLPEFMRRDLRWCQGNMQYLKLLNMPGVLPMSRFQMIWAVMMFVGVPAWTAIIALIAFKPLDGESSTGFPVASALGLYAVFILMYLAPKLVGYLDVALTRGELARYGGAPRFFAGALAEIVFSLLIAPATTLSTALFMVGLLFGRAIGWGGQQRDAHAVSLADAARNLWPQLTFGLALFIAAGVMAPALIAPSLPLTAGYLLAIPFAMLTAAPAFGQALTHARLCAIPEEFDTPRELVEVGQRLAAAASRQDSPT